MKKILLLLSMLLTHILYAELPPYVYDDLKNNAPESLTIEVTQVERSSLLFEGTTVTAKAKVIRTVRSATALQRGDSITIRYTTTAGTIKPGWVGPSPVPILKEGKSYKAYLIKEDEKSEYKPAARGKSFSIIP